ncbi:hypothetical protein CGRA01v4_05245 [Colletotrichum graminicola]|uniref:Uncharacterized protein n=1 Tax=Colletotrichum graminicola (strain M1.001 / M2 / FGSC 10212) TaxID=645133 RepID=E3Q5T6_COLGM|nr:uncharacterized protein GLRG_01328 [Colletotrichum graminicola M1.001]EFQ26184.1 hypothetical protein GLRG_01328 [Colletotrichum graminicola M1.001]WDK13963.1 hypothetical protein CGRA01v4_05245 [Colletotrichum graminicola]
MIDDFSSYDMSDIFSPLEGLPSIIRLSSFFGDAPSFFLLTGTTDGSKGKPGAMEKGDESPRGRKDSVMMGVYGSGSGSSASASASASASSVASCKKPAVTVRKRVLGVDEKGESSCSAKGVLSPCDGSRDDKHKIKDEDGDEVTREKTPGSAVPRRSRFVEDLEGLRAEAVGRTPAEVCQQICLPEAAGMAAKGAGSVKLHFPPAVAIPVPPPKKELPRPALKEGRPPLSTTSSPGRLCHHDGACVRKKGRRRRKFAQAVVRLATKPARWRREDKGKRRAACEVCGDDAPPDLRSGWEQGQDGVAPGSDGDSGAADEVAELLSLLYDKDETKSSRRCSGCGQKVGEELMWEGDEDARMKMSDGTTLGLKEEAANQDSKDVAASLMEMPEAWWTRQFGCNAHLY